MSTFINWFADHQGILGWEITGLIIGMFLLYFGGDWLVDSASDIAKKLGVRPMIIGLTIVALGTSLPELLVSTISGLQNQASVAIGNVVGSNITNIALILGLAALLKPIAIEKESISLHPAHPGAYLVTLICSLAVLAVAFNGEVNRLEGILLVCGLVAFTIWQIQCAKKSRNEQIKAVTDVASSEVTGEENEPVKSWLSNIVFLILGLIGISLGAKWLIDGGVGIAREIGISELVIGLTIVALGTSLPELATSVIGIIKGEDDIAVGNILGSNIFNVLAVLGTAAAIQPMGVEHTALVRDIPLMIGLTILLYVLMRPGYYLSRLKGGILLGCYLAYTVCIYIIR